MGVSRMSFFTPRLSRSGPWRPPAHGVNGVENRVFRSPCRLILRKSGLAQTVEKTLAIGRAAEWTCQSLIPHGQPGHQTYEFIETGARVVHAPKMRRGCGKRDMRIRKRRIAIDRSPAAVRGLFEILRAQMRPGTHGEPDDHQEVARAEPYGFLHILN